MWIYLILLILSLTYIWFKQRYSYWKRHGFPQVPGVFPFGSMGFSFLTQHNNNFFHREYEKFKNKSPAFGMYFFNIKTLVLTDLELIKEILVNNFENFHHRGFNFNEKIDPLLVNIFNTRGQKWTELKAKMSSIFTTSRIKAMFPIISMSNKRLIDYLEPLVEKNELIEVKQIFQELSVEIITSTAFGIETKCLGEPKNEFFKIAKQFSQPTIIEEFFILFAMSFGRIFNLLKLRIVPEKINNFFLRALYDSLVFREQNQILRHDFFQLMTNMMKNEEVKLPFWEMAANCFLFLTAGFDTTANTMTFLAYELAMNPEIQENLRSEITKVLEQFEDEISFESISKMEYLDMVFNETLRKWPVVNIQFRKSSNDFKIKNFNLVIPKNTLIVIPVYGIHHDEKYYENPEKFDPERFSNENKKKIVEMSFIPFSDGPRACIGSQFGIMQIKITFVKLLRRYRLKLSEKTTNPIKFNPDTTLLSPEGGMWLKLENI